MVVCSRQLTSGKTLAGCAGGIAKTISERRQVRKRMRCDKCSFKDYKYENW